MNKTRLGERFFESTRGRVVRLMRGRVLTVNDLVAELGMTDNAVRAHLVTLERDGLIRQAGTQPGFRKPHFAYELTPEGEKLFPKSYDALLNTLLDVLKQKLSGRELVNILHEVGRKAASAFSGRSSESASSSDQLARAAIAVKVLEDLGGAPRLEETGNKIMIHSASCPFADAVEQHPEVCHVAEALVGQITGGRVHEKCDKTAHPPSCSFEISKKTTR